MTTKQEIGVFFLIQFLCVFRRVQAIQNFMVSVQKNHGLVRAGEVILLFVLFVLSSVIQVGNVIMEAINTC